MFSNKIRITAHYKAAAPLNIFYKTLLFKFCVRAGNCEYTYFKLFSQSPEGGESLLLFKLT